MYNLVLTLSEALVHQELRPADVPSFLCIPKRHKVWPTSAAAASPVEGDVFHMAAAAAALKRERGANLSHDREAMMTAGESGECAASSIASLFSSLHSFLLRQGGKSGRFRAATAPQ